MEDNFLGELASNLFAKIVAQNVNFENTKSLGFIQHPSLSEFLLKEQQQDKVDGA